MFGVIRAAVLSSLFCGVVAARLPHIAARVAEREDALPIARYGSSPTSANGSKPCSEAESAAHWLLDSDELVPRHASRSSTSSRIARSSSCFIRQSDASGRLLLARRVLHAGGARSSVRILMDDFGVAGRGGDVLWLDAHPLIEVAVRPVDRAARGLRQRPVPHARLHVSRRIHD